jgi:2-polyprenyl-6-methoxyphenol hydroxylase-like FAD-dependent oxidoreductase
MQAERVAIVGAGIGGLTLALCLHRAGIACRVYEQAAQIRPLGVGINILPHATAELRALGVLEALERVAVTTREAAFFNRFGQLVYTEPAGRWAGYETPQLSIHRGDLQGVLLAAVKERLGSDAVVAGHGCVGVDAAGADAVRLRFRDPSGAPLPEAEATLAIACDGIHSAIRRQLHPSEGPPRWSGVNMWRGVTDARAVPERRDHGPGRLADGRQDGDLSDPQRCRRPGPPARQLGRRAGGEGAGRARLERPRPARRLLRRVRRLALRLARRRRADRGTETVLAYPMVDQDPLPRWSFGRVTLLGDAAHPMVPRGSNGAGQAILDARFLTDWLLAQGLTPEALTEYDRVRNAATAKVVLMNRSNPPDAILREVHERSGDRPFARVEDVVSREELARSPMPTSRSRG